MHKLQDVIETVLGDIDEKPRSVVPSDTAILRDRRLREVASKIEKLKQARLRAQGPQ